MYDLSGANAYTGATTIGAGTELVLSTTGSIADSSGVTANGDFDITSHTGNVSIKNLAGGTGSVTLGSNTLILTAASSDAFAGAIEARADLPSAGAPRLSPATIPLPAPPPSIWARL